MTERTPPVWPALNRRRSMKRAVYKIYKEDLDRADESPMPPRVAEILEPLGSYRDNWTPRSRTSGRVRRVDDLHEAWFTGLGTRTRRSGLGERGVRR